MMNDYKYILDRHGTMCIDPLPTTEEMRKYYQDKYYQEGTAQYTGKYTDQEIEFFNVFPRVMIHLLKQSGVDYGSVLDIGCGEGFQLAAFKKAGFECYGADFSINGIEQQNPELLKEIEFHQGDIVNDDVFAGKTFDAIFSNNVFEHVIDIDKFMTNFSNLCHENTLVFIQVPNEMNPFQKHRMKRLGETVEEQKWYAPPEHIRYFTPTSLKTTVEEYGFECLTMYGTFPIDMFLQNEKTDYYATDFGKTAYALQMDFSILLSQDISAYVKYLEAMMGLSIGRDVVGVFRQKVRYSL